MSDHYPTCPRCGDLCGKLARICVSCGARLILSAGDREQLGLNPDAAKLPERLETQEES